MKKMKIRNVGVLLFALMWMWFLPISARAEEVPASGSLTIHNADQNGESEVPVAGVEYTLWQVDETNPRPTSPKEAKGRLIAGTERSGKTDANGNVVFSSLPAGLYYVEETDLGEKTGIAFPNAPFLADVPMTNERGDGWVSDYTVNLKNQALSIDKYVNGPGEDEYDKEDVNKAKHRPVSKTDKFGYSIVAYFPDKLGALSGETYQITDQVNENVIADYDTLKVYSMSDPKGSYQDGFLLTEGQHYQKVVDEENRTMVLTLTQEGMDLLNSRSEEMNDHFLLLKYDGQLSGNAVNGINLYSGASLTYERPGTTPDQSANSITVNVVEEPEVHTGQIGLLKVDAEKPDTKLANAKFGIAISEEDAKEGRFIASGTTDDQGKLVFKGLAYGEPGDDCETNSSNTSYWLSEVEAPQGYERIAEPIEIVFAYQEGEDGEFYFANVTAHNQPTKEQPVPPPSKGDPVKTGDTAAVSLLLSLLVVSIGVMVLIKKKNNK